MPKRNDPDVRVDEMKGTAAEQLRDLWDMHQDEFMKVLTEAEVKKLNLNFTVKLDFSDSKATLETTMSFSQVVKDKRTAEFEDPNAPFLPGVDPAAVNADQEETKKRGRRNKQKDEGADTE